jgi:hypothetical protein
MRWHTVRFDARANRVEIYRHAEDYCEGDPLILIDTALERFGRTPQGAEALAAWVGRIVLSDNPALSQELGV